MRSWAEIRGGNAVSPEDHFPFLAERSEEMTPEETEAYFEALARQMGGSVAATEGDDGAQGS